jgi:transcriptional regulator with XRE-family HTH domain
MSTRTKSEPGLIGQSGCIFSVIMGRKRHQPSDFGVRLARLRKNRGLTQAQLAAAAGVTQANISYYENGARDPTASTIAILSRALRVSTDVLLGMKPARAVNDLDTQTLRLWRKLDEVKRLPEKDRRSVVQHIEALLERQTLKRAQG